MNEWKCIVEKSKNSQTRCNKLPRYIWEGVSTVGWPSQSIVGYFPQSNLLSHQFIFYFPMFSQNVLKRILKILVAPKVRKPMRGITKYELNEYNVGHIYFFAVYLIRKYVCISIS